jgi:hypothetical protein
MKGDCARKHMDILACVKKASRTVNELVAVTGADRKTIANILKAAEEEGLLLRVAGTNKKESWGRAFLWTWVP